MQRIITILQDKKLWATALGLLVSMGILELSDAQQSELIAAILAAGSAIGYMVTVGNEQAARIRQADAQPRQIAASMLEERMAILEKRMDDLMYMHTLREGD